MCSAQMCLMEEIHEHFFILILLKKSFTSIRVTLFYKKSKAKTGNVIFPFLRLKDSKKPKFDHLEGHLVVLARDSNL